MLSDIEIAKQAKMLKIGEVAAKLGISEDEYEPYGHYKAKLSESLYAKTKNDPDGKLILVTAINPTPAGEGKTTISVGLAESMNKIGKKAIVALREPSLGPCFGMKGGAAGGGEGRFLQNAGHHLSPFQAGEPGGVPPHHGPDGAGGGGAP